MPAMLSLGRGRALRVTVQYQTADREWQTVDSTGFWRRASARRLSLVPVTDASGALLGHLGQDGGMYPSTPAGWAHVNG